MSMGSVPYPYSLTWVSADCAIDLPRLVYFARHTCAASRLCGADGERLQLQEMHLFSASSAAISFMSSASMPVGSDAIMCSDVMWRSFPSARRAFARSLVRLTLGA